jgi:2-polyprenyl-3-methyl-5-hydroxy-6-metoxy-1,4-benzoquinol methylase
MIATCVVSSGHRAPGLAFRKKETDIYICPDCETIMADIGLHNEQYEVPEYYTMRFPDLAAIDDEWGFRWRHILSTLVRLNTGKRILDVGAGNGYFAHLAEREFELDALGLEISKQEIEFAKEKLGIQLSDAPLDTLGRDFDFVTCFNVLEHVDDPKALIESMAARLEPGGLLAITTPNIGCIQARKNGFERWIMVDPPHHINLFSREGLIALFEPREWNVVHYQAISTYIQFVRKYDTDKLHLRRLMFNLLSATGLGADHFIVLKKNGARH